MVTIETCKLLTDSARWKFYMTQHLTEKGKERDRDKDVRQIPRSFNGYKVSK